MINIQDFDIDEVREAVYENLLYSDTVLTVASNNMTLREYDPIFFNPGLLK